MKKIAIILGIVIALVATSGLLFLNSMGIFASDPFFTTARGALDGYDPVAFFEQQKAIVGQPSFTFEYAGAEWRFSSEENRDLFVRNPQRFLPQYGGYCSWAMANGYTARTDPEAWTIVDERLYLNFDLDVKQDWEKDRESLIHAANKNWPDSKPAKGAL